MSQQEVISLARTLGVEVPGDFQSMDDTAAPAGSDATMDTTDNAGNELDTAFIADNSINRSAIDQFDSSAVAAMDASADSPTQQDSSHDDTISAFCAVTGADPTAAGHLLEVRACYFSC
jgi:hypothetical protein